MYGAHTVHTQWNHGFLFFIDLLCTYGPTFIIGMIMYV